LTSIRRRKGETEMDLRVKRFERRYAEVLEEPSLLRREKMLGDLLAEIRETFSVPTSHDPSWEEDHPDVSGLYRKVLSSRIAKG